VGITAFKNMEQENSLRITNHTEFKPVYAIPVDFSGVIKGINNRSCKSKMVKMVIGSLICLVATGFAILAMADLMWYSTLGFCVFWYVISGSLIYSGYKKLHKKSI
jgi:hypothetical protein